MSATVEVSYLLLDATIQTIERLMHDLDAAGLGDTESEDEQVLSELRALLVQDIPGSNEAQDEDSDAEEESAETPVAKEAEEETAGA